MRRKTEYKLSWKRQGWEVWKTKTYWQRPALERRKMFLTDPRRALIEMHCRTSYCTEGDYLCCNGGMCGCGGQTVGQWADGEIKRYDDLPPIVKIKVESRIHEIDDWTIAS